MIMWVDRWIAHPTLELLNYMFTWPVVGGFDGTAMWASEWIVSLVCNRDIPENQ